MDPTNWVGNRRGARTEAKMISVLLAIVAGVLCGRWLGQQEPSKVATQKVRVGDLRRSTQGRR
jgi:hypothetical protein